MLERHVDSFLNNTLLRSLLSSELVHTDDFFNNPGHMFSKI